MGKRVSCDEQRLMDLVREGLTNSQLAERLGVTVRTIDRWRAERPELRAAINAERARLRRAALRPCGTVAAYHRGCRCEPCREANRVNHRAWELSRREKAGLPPPHAMRGRPRKPPFAPPEPPEYEPDVREQVEQAIARGCGTRWIMDAFGWPYADVKAVRDELLTGAA